MLLFLFVIFFLVCVPFFYSSLSLSPSLIFKQAQQILQGGDKKELVFDRWGMVCAERTIFFHFFFLRFSFVCLRQRNETSNCHDTLLFEMCILLQTAMILFDRTFTTISRFPNTVLFDSIKKNGTCKQDIARTMYTLLLSV